MGFDVYVGVGLNLDGERDKSLEVIFETHNITPFSDNEREKALPLFLSGASRVQVIREGGIHEAYRRMPENDTALVQKERLYKFNYFEKISL